MLTTEVKQSIDESVLCWLATADSTGMPNCSPKEVFTYLGEQEMIIANIASPNSVNNIQNNPNVCLSFVNVFKQKGFKLKGKATSITPQDNEFAELIKLIKPLAGDFPVKSIIRIKIVSVSPIVAPSYFLVPGTTEESQIIKAKKTYGV